MLLIDVPGVGNLKLKHLVLDYNGTLALDGILQAGVPERIIALSETLDVHVVTADTFGHARQQLQGLPVTLHILEGSAETLQKRAYVERLGADTTAVIGNGSNDEAMLAAAAMSICVLGPEGCSLRTMNEADILVRDIREGLDLLSETKRITATLRE